MLDFKRWTLNTYTPATETDFIIAGGSKGATIRTLVIVNTTALSIDCEMVLTDAANAKLATLLPLAGIPAKGTVPWKMGPIEIPTGEKIRITGADSGLEFYAGGAEE